MAGKGNSNIVPFEKVTTVCIDVSDVASDKAHDLAYVAASRRKTLLELIRRRKGRSAKNTTEFATLIRK